MADEPIVVRGIEIPESELSWRFSRASGPGGQNVNKRDTRVELVFDLARSAVIGPVRKERALERLRGRLAGGVLTVVASGQRSQARNRDDARARLTEVLHEALAPPPRTRRPTRPSRGAVERRLESKRRRSETKARRRAPDV